MAAAIQAKTGVDATLIKGDNGIFDVGVDGERIYSKGETGRFPEDNEILEQLDG